MPKSETNTGTKDQFEIHGDEVVEGEIKPIGGSAHVTLKKKHRGKRAKVVIIDDSDGGE
ncbi:DUF2080 family transposase-associated protein [Halobaculum sp. D14]|uniref:DUF2080 family transposase-associated protein n=1 Tax=Halobaculum sp. D14 TaxID=3421642 RepID=UPI003EB9D1FC